METLKIKLVRYYVYAYLNLDKPVNYSIDTSHGIVQFDHEPIYIGKGSGNRIYDHLNNSKNAHLHNTIKQHNYKFIILFKDLPNLESYRLENELIYNIGRLDINTGPLANKTGGLNLNESKGEISPLNLELNKLFNIIKALNSSKTIEEASNKLEISSRSLFRYIKDYSLKKIDGEYVQLESV